MDWTDCTRIVRQLLIPLHNKIRVGFGDLENIAAGLIRPRLQTQLGRELGIDEDAIEKLPKIASRVWIERGHKYAIRILTDKILAKEEATKFVRHVVFPRYVGVVRIDSEAIGSFDVVVDTTSPQPNYNWLAVIGAHEPGEKGELRERMLEFIAYSCQCPYYA